MGIVGNGYRTAGWSLLLVSLAFLFVRYGEVLRAPNSVIFCDHGDGVKNYYTFLYHIRNDESAWSFTGMNHPYGEHVFFTDGHPALASLLRLIAVPFPGVTDHAAGILNVLLLLALPFCALCIFLVLRELRVRPWMAAACAFGIMLLAPQTQRLTGHLALAYSFFLPLAWWLFMRVRRSERSWLPMLALGLLGLAGWGTHAYLGVMVAAFVAVMAIAWAVTHRRDATQRKKAIMVLLSACITPTALFRTIIAITDHHIGRSQHPTGFLNYTAEPDDILLPFLPPLRPLLDELLPGMIRQQWEALAYIGMGTLLVLLAWAIASMWRGRRKDPWPMELRVAKLAAMLLLLFAFGIPFKDAPSLLRAMPILEQFRALGRFTWPFFFVATITAVCLVDRWAVRASSRGWPVGSLLLACALPISFVIEGLPYQCIATELTRTPNLFSLEHLPPEQRALMEHIPAERYQAVIPMPFFNYGSESFTRGSKDGITRAVLPISYHKRLPILGSILSRVSIPESKKILQVVSPRFYPKTIKDDITDDRPFLIIRSAEDLSAYELDLLRSAIVVDTTTAIKVYELSKAELFRNTADEVWSRFRSRDDLLTGLSGFSTTDSLGRFAYFDFEERNTNITHNGKGALETTKLGEQLIASVSMAGLERGDQAIASLWMYNGIEEALNQGLWLQVVQHVNGKEHVARIWPNEAEVVDGDWSLVELPFTVLSDDPQLIIRTRCDHYIQRPMIVDDVLVRRADSDVYRSDSLPDGRSVLFWNDHRVLAP